MVKPWGPVLVGAVLALFAPAALAGDGPTGGAEVPDAPPATRTVSADGPVALRARAGTMLRRVARFRGTVPPVEAGAAVTIERLDAAAGAWSAIATTTAATDGTFLARWRTDRAGLHRVRAVVRRSGAATAASASGEVAITVHRAALATWYGPGLYGSRTACGQRLTRTLVGVAHRRLPCGTRVALLYRGRTMVVPVVDRGPFRRKVRWDLTSATAGALGFEGSGRLGSVRVQRSR
jgi:hypothetical protein